MVDLETGQVTRLEPAERLAAPGGWLELDNVMDRERPVIVARRLDSFGELMANSTVQTSLSPDGHWLVWTDRFLLREPVLGPGAPSQWPVVVLADMQRGGQLVLRVARASTVVAERTLGWLSDSSGFLVATPDGYAIVRVAGSLEPLPFGPADALGPVPAPAPNDPRLFVFNSSVVALSGAAISPPVESAAWAGAGPNTDYGLNTDGTELRLVRSKPGGRDFALGVPSALGLPAHLQLPPSSDALHLRVDTAGDNLNVRQEPGVSAQAVGQLPDGAIVTVTDGPGGFLGGPWCAEGCSVAPDHPPPLDRTAWWVHVEAGGGLQGWVRPEFLAWPVEITSVITFTPTVRPATVLDGSCWAPPIAIARPEAWRCTSGNEIRDPCFGSEGATEVICVRDPTKPNEAVVLRLTTPPPTQTPPNADTRPPWMLQLSDGMLCWLQQGTSGVVNGERVNYSCADGSGILGVPTPGATWTARRVATGTAVPPAGVTVPEEMVTLRTVWR